MSQRCINSSNRLIVVFPTSEDHSWSAHTTMSLNIDGIRLLVSALCFFNALMLLAGLQEARSHCKTPVLQLTVVHSLWQNW